MPISRSAKIRRELARPARQLSRLIYRSASSVYSPFIYDHTQRSKVRTSPGAVALKDHVCIYVIAPFFGLWPSRLAALDYMLEAGVSPITVSNMPLSEKDKASISERSAIVIERPNHGYDFGAYREANLYLRDRLDSLTRLTLLNDSTWFPAPGSQNWFASVEQSPTDFIGATSNFGGSTIVPKSLTPEPWDYGSFASGYHLQSFAVSFSPNVLRNQSFFEFWKNYPLVNDKDLTVKRGEKGLTKWALEQGLSMSSTYPVEQLDSLLENLPFERLQQISENVIVLGNPRFETLKREVLQSCPDAETLRSFLLAAARCLGVSYALPDFNLREMRFPFLKKTPVWHQREASDITMRIINSFGDTWDVAEEAQYLRRTLLK